MRVLITETTWPVMAVSKDLAEAGFRLSRVDDGQGMLDFVRHGRQDAVLVAASLPDLDPVVAVAQVRRMAPRLPVVVLAEPAVAWPRRRSLYDAGADAVLDLPIDADELAARLRVMVLRAAGFPTGRISFGGLELDPAALTALAVLAPAGASAGGPEEPRGATSGGANGDTGGRGAIRIPLSPREYDLLEMLALARGRTVSRAEVMDRLYAFEDEPGPRIIDVYVARIRAKLAAAGLPPGMLVSLRARGLRLDEAPAALPGALRERALTAMPEREHGPVPAGRDAGTAAA